MKLAVKGLSFSYRGKSVLRNINLEAAAGEVIALVGKNGAGKSTLLRCINGILKPSSGTVHVDEANTAKMDFRKRAQVMAYLSQKNEQAFPVTVFDAVLLGRYPYSPFRFTRTDEEITSGVIAEMGLTGLADRQIDTLSGGEQQQTLISRALVQEAGVLLFDEPTNNLDLRHQVDIMKTLGRITHEKGVAALIAIHDLNLAAAFANRVAVLHQGEIFSVGTPLEVLTKQTLKTVFDIDANVYVRDNIPAIIL